LFKNGKKPKGYSWNTKGGGKFTVDHGTLETKKKMARNLHERSGILENATLVSKRSETASQGDLLRDTMERNTKGKKGRIIGQSNGR